MKNIVLFFITFLRLTNCLKLSAEHINCVLYRTYTDFQIINASVPEQILEDDRFNSSLKTVFFIPGVPSPIKSNVTRTLFEAYIRSKRYNVIQLSHYYYTPKREIPGVFDEMMYWFGETYGSVISKLIKLGVPVSSIELVGHSYGSCVALLTAKNTFPKLPLLIGLDPIPLVHFQKGSADYTIALHSNMGLMGIRNYKDCDSNLIPNGGTFQPNCPIQKLSQIVSENEFNELNECNHRAAIKYWSSMIDNPNLFYGVSCNDTTCNYNNIQLLGPNLRTPGIFYFKTSSDYPFGLGIEGVKNVTLVDNGMLDALQVYRNHFQP